MTRKPTGWFTIARGGERIRQAWTRAVDAGASDSDLVVLGAVFVHTVGWSKLDDSTTLTGLAITLGRWDDSTPDEGEEARQERNRQRVKDRLGQSLRRLADMGAVEYEPGRGGRRSRISLPPLDDLQPHDPRGERVESQPHEERGVRETSTPRGAVVNPTGDGRQPHSARSSTPRPAVGTTDRTDGSDRTQSGSIEPDARVASGRPARSTRSKASTSVALTEEELAALFEMLPQAGILHAAIGRHTPDRPNKAKPLDVWQMARYHHDLEYGEHADAVAQLYRQLETGHIASPRKAHHDLRELAEHYGADPDDLPPYPEVDPDLTTDQLRQLARETLQLLDDLDDLDDPGPADLDDLAAEVAVDLATEPPTR